MKSFLLRTSLAVILTTMLGVPLLAQEPEKIHQLEYFFDTDPGFGNGIIVPISPAASTVTGFNFTPDISSLGNGFHALYTRVLDSGERWSQTASKLLYKEAAFSNPIPNAVAAEYFIDTDPGFGNGTPATLTSGQTVTFPFNTTIVPLPRGLHKLFVRVRDANGNWSHSISRLFYKEHAFANPAPNVVAAEYFFNSDPGFGNAISATVTAGQIVSLNIEGDITSLPNGLNFFYVRTKDAAGKWSHTIPQLFYKEPAVTNPIADVVQAEYFFDSDPGFGNATQATLTSGQTVSFDIIGDISTLTNGLHHFYLRTKDANGKWSLTTNQLFYKEAPVSNPVPDIVQAEYYFDIDPGFGNATQFSVTPGVTIVQNISIPANGLTNGMHRLYTRVKDANGKWSLTNTQLLYYEAAVTVNPVGDLITLEWFWETDPGFGNANKVTLPAGNNGQISNFMFEAAIPWQYSGTKQNFYLRVSNDWSLTTVRVIDFSSIVLPVTLLEFTAMAQDKHVLTKWSTSQEINSSHFDIEHSSDGINFEKFGTVRAQGSSSMVTAYELLHTRPVRGLNYYRLKQVDIDGAYTYSPVVKIMFNGGMEKITTYPNPVQDILTVEVPQSVLSQGGKYIYLYDSKGALVMKHPLGAAKNLLQMKKFVNGNYVVVIMDHEEQQPIFRQMILKH